MRVAAALQRYNDFSQQGLQAGGGAAYQQLDRGPYSSVALVGQDDKAAFYADHTNRQLAKQGAWPSEVISAVVLLTNPGYAIMNGSPVTTDDVLLAGPDSEYETVTNADLKVAVLHLHLESEIAIPLRLLANQRQRKISRIADPELARQFRDLATNILRSWDQASQSISIPHSALQKMMFDLLTSPSATNGSLHPSIHIYRAARDAMLDAMGETLTISEIASRTGTSRRTLEYAFDKCTSVSPAQFHKLLRLNNARRLLESGQYSVSRAAITSGLRHLGRFSGDYHDLFGELPSQTALRARALPVESA